MQETYDMVIVGGGPGGYVAALKGRKLGLHVALVERKKVGGVCLNEGCIPTKTLLADVEGALWLRRAVRDGIVENVPKISFAAMAKRKAAVVEKMVTHLEEFLLGSGVVLVHGVASIPERGLVVTDTGAKLETQNVVIATGSQSWIPPIPGAGLPGVVTTSDMLQADSVPQRLVIVGGGIIGQEFAAIFSALGSKVVVLEVLDRILLEVDVDIARRYATLASARGITTEVGITVRGIEGSPGSLSVTYEKKAKEKKVEADLILMATGRRPDFGGVSLSDLGVSTRNGAIAVDEKLETSVPGVYAIGDVIGQKMLAHVASYHGELVAEIVAGRDVRVAEEAVPACIFTIPEIAWSGLTEREASLRGLKYRTSTFPLSASGKAQAAGEVHGLVKLIEDVDTGKLIGAHLMGPHVSELVGELTLAVRAGMSAADVVGTIHPHPTISESVREAALGFLDGPIHSQPRVRASSK
jgi:dihydrolipoamide dehydrogenase